jgi:hypothetical protein
MNTKITALTLAAATAFAFTPKPASADHGDGAAIFGAIVGGAIIGAAIASANNDHAPVYVSSGSCPPPAPVYVADGYWATASVNVWVPAVWVVERDYYGRNCRRYVAGHYECRNERHWVAYNRPVYRGHEVASGYGHDNRSHGNDHRDNGHSDSNGRDHR